MKSMQQRAFAAPLIVTVLLSLVAMLALVQPVLADEYMNISDVKACRVIESTVERLLCYDTVVDGGVFDQQKLKQVQIETFGSSNMPKETRAKPETKTVTEAKTATESETKSVTETKTKPEAGTGTDISVDKITVTIVRTQKDASGRRYFQTSDGQVWKQQNSTNWGLKAPFEAEIKSGMMGSFFLVNEGGQSTRVKRVR